MKVPYVSHTDDLDFETDLDASFPADLTNAGQDNDLLEEGDVYDAIVERACFGGNLLDELADNDPALEDYYEASAYRLMAALKAAQGELHGLDDEWSDVEFLSAESNVGRFAESLPVMRLSRLGNEATSARRYPALEELCGRQDDEVLSASDFSNQ
jgi:hypothetical protein